MNTKSRSCRPGLLSRQSPRGVGAGRACWPLCLVALILCMSAAAFAQVSSVNTEEDTQLWNDIQLAVGLNREVDFNLFGTFRFGRDVTHLVDRRAGTGFTFRVGKYLTLAPSYLNIVTRPFEGRKGNENRLIFAATVRFPLGKFVLSDRNQFERRLRYPIKSTRYRNRLQVERTVKLGSAPLSLFAADEIQYDWSLNGWTRNRFFAGVSRRFSKHFTGDVYFMRQNDGRGRPGDLNVIGATYRLRF